MRAIAHAAATLTRVATFLVVAPAWLFERGVRRFIRRWAFDPYSSTPYFLILVLLAWYGVSFGGAKLTRWRHVLAASVGIYVLSCLEILALWLCLTIATGHRGAVFDGLKRVMWWSSRKIRSTPFDARSLYMGIGAYIYTAFYFACVDTLIYRAVTDAYHGIVWTSSIDLAGQFLYYSVVTMATVGYGDIYPTSWHSRLAAMAEIMLGLFFGLFLFATFVSGFVGRLSEKKAG